MNINDLNYNEFLKYAEEIKIRNDGIDCINDRITNLNKKIDDMKIKLNVINKKIDKVEPIIKTKGKLNNN